MTMSGYIFRIFSPSWTSIARSFQRAIRTSFVLLRVLTRLQLRRKNQSRSLLFSTFTPPPPPPPPHAHPLPSLPPFSLWCPTGRIPLCKVRNPALERALVSKQVRSLSGVLVVTVLTSPYPEYDAPGKGGKPGKRKVQRFSCKHNCYYCPNEPAHEGNNFVPQPRSYLHDEPGVRRANRCGKWGQAALKSVKCPVCWCDASSGSAFHATKLTNR